MLKSIQGLRGVAAIGVVLLHQMFWYKAYSQLTSTPTPGLINVAYLLNAGGMGVHIFFVISGFVMGLQTANRGVAGGVHFMWRRIVRIVPMYWLITIIAAILTPASWGSLVQSFLFIPSTGFPILGVGWTLNFEMFFYLLFAAVVTFFGKSVWHIVGALIIISTIRLASGGALLDIIGNPIILEFGAGLIVSQIYRMDIVSRFSKPLLVAGAGGLGLSVFLFLPASEVSFKALLWWGIPSTLLILGAAAAEASGRIAVLSGPVMQQIGAASYSIYLTHTLALHQINWSLTHDLHLSALLSPDGCLLVIVAACVAGGIAVYYLVERPIISLMRHWTLPPLLSKRPAI